MQFIAQMVAKNEASRYLIEVLEHLQKIVDVIVFTDDCSTDETPEIASSFGAAVFRNEESWFAKDESELRTRAWQNLERFAQPGDWILCCDADEMLYGTENLQLLLDQKRFDVLGIEFYHMWNLTHYRVDKAWRPNYSSRLFRYYRGGSFHRRRLAPGSEPMYVRELIRQGKVLWDTGLKFQHWGYALDQDKTSKFHRYMELDAGEFHSRAHIESILDPRPTLEEWSF